MPYLGELRAFQSELPDGWLPCEGQLLKVDKHQALFSLLAYHYGGAGELFALPDLRGRATAGVDPRRDLRLGETSGLSGDNSTEIPYRVLRWGIHMWGHYPLR